MGCFFPKPPKTPIREISNVFKVTNIDQDGKDHSAGEIEIDFESLKLHANPNQPFVWPLRSLRRYGYENDIFSFEVGRKCPTGEGIYAFRCEHADQLFRLLQNNIQRGINNANPVQNMGVDGNNADSRSGNLRNSRHESVGSWTSCPHTPTSPTQSPTDIDNFDLKTTDHRMLEKKNSNNEDGSSNPVYINVIPNSEEPREPSTSNYIYSNNEEITPSLFIAPYQQESLIGDNHSPQNLQYTQLDFPDDTSIIPVPKMLEEENESPPQYTVIDIYRTVALSQSTKPSVKNDFGCQRRTRHNPTPYGVCK